MSAPIQQNDSLAKDLRITGCPKELNYEGRDWTAIGQGYQYTAYGTSDEVLKIPLTAEQVHAKFRIYDAGMTLEQAEEISSNGFIVIRLMKEKLDEQKLPKNIFANPLINSDLSVMQDKVLPLREAFNCADELEKQKLIMQYAQMASDLFQYGAYETGFGLLDNFGLDAKGKIVLLDFGELTFDRNEALSSIRDRKWMDDRGGCKFFDGELLAYYERVMEVFFNERVLDKSWSSNA